jgi:inosose dehydratase
MSYLRQYLFFYKPASTFSKMKYSRNEFLKLAGSGLSGAFISPASPGLVRSFGSDEQLNYGLSSYTFRDFNLDDTIKMTLRVGIKNISLKSMHMPLESSADDIKSIAEKVRSAGLNLYGAGVIYMKTKEEVDATFDYAANAGLKMIIGVPNHELLPLVNEKVKRTNIILAIHNHGPGDKLYTSPNDVYEKVKGLDKRVGLCIDIGHVRRIGQDPVWMLNKYKDRLYDMHMKDVDKPIAEGGPIEIGRGIIDIPNVVKTLKKTNYTGNMTFEFEKDGNDPLPGLAESVGYVRGIAKVV